MHRYRSRTENLMKTTSSTKQKIMNELSICVSGKLNEQLSGNAKEIKQMHSSGVYKLRNQIAEEYELEEQLNTKCNNQL